MKEEELKILNYKILDLNDTLTNFSQITFCVQENNKEIHYLLHVNKKIMDNQKTCYVYHSSNACHYCSGSRYEECVKMSPLGEALYEKLKQDPVIRLKLLLK